jgi:hypothetical protein
MTGPEAAKMLGVHRNVVTKWRRKDKLRAVSGPKIDGFGCHLYSRRDIKRMKRKRAQHYAGQQELVFEP